MQLRQLRYFIAVAEVLSFSRAAERLHVSQPPLSRQIGQLEAELGAKLFDRNRQAVRLTKLGNAILARSRALIRDADSFKTEAKMLYTQTGISGNIKRLIDASWRAKAINLAT